MARPEHLAELDRRARARFEEAAAALRSNLEAQLREVSERLFSAVAEARADLPDSLLDRDALEAVGAEARHEGTQQALAALLESAHAFDRAATQGAVLEALLAGARRFAPRAVLLLTGEQGWRGWGAAGFSADADPIAGREGGYDGAALESFATGRGTVVAHDLDARELAAGLGLPEAAESCLVPLVLRDRVAAALYVDRREGESEPPLAACQLLVASAAQRIELQPLSARAATPTFAAPGAAIDGLPLWSPGVATAAVPEVETTPVSREAEEEGFTFVPEEAALPEAPSEEEELEKTDVSEPFRTAAEPAPQPALEAYAPSASSVEEPPATVEEPAPETPAFDYSAEFVPVVEEETLRRGELVFAPPSDEEAPVIELAPEEPMEAEIEVAPEATWQTEEGEATAYLGSVSPTPAAEVGETSAPVPAQQGESDLSETRAISTPGRSPVPPPAAPPPGPASTIAFQPPPTSLDPNEEATVMLDRSRTLPAASPPPPPPPAREEDPNDRTAGRATKSTEVAPPPDLRGPGLAFSSARGARATGESALHEEARRLARLLISEIKLYNEDQVAEGRRNRDLYHRLKDDIDRSRQIYDERVHESVRETSDYFQQELVRSLAGGDARALGV